MADLAFDAQKMAQATWRPEAFVDLLAERVVDWLSPPKRARLVARFELFMIASHEPELSSIVTQQRAHFLQATEAALSRAGVAQAAAVAPMLMVLVDAVLLDHIGASGPVLPLAQQKAMFRMVLAAQGG
jgi:hypothetical protein